MKKSEMVKLAIFALMDDKNTDPDAVFDALAYLFDKYALELMYERSNNGNS